MPPVMFCPVIIILLWLDKVVTGMIPYYRILLLFLTFCAFDKFTFCTSGIIEDKKGNDTFLIGFNETHEGKLFYKSDIAWNSYCTATTEGALSENRTCHMTDFMPLHNFHCTTADYPIALAGIRSLLLLQYFDHYFCILFGVCFPLFFISCGIHMSLKCSRLIVGLKSPVI